MSKNIRVVARNEIITCRCRQWSYKFPPNVSVQYKQSGSSADKFTLPLSLKAEKAGENMDLTVDDEKTDEQCYENTTFIGLYICCACILMQLGWNGCKYYFL